MKNEGEDGCHVSCSPGLTMEDALVEQRETWDGQRYWYASARIGTVFGQEVQGGEISGFGRTREIALARLDEERAKLYESLWS